jgi:hypothetical protein
MDTKRSGRDIHAQRHHAAAGSLQEVRDFVWHRSAYRQDTPLPSLQVASETTAQQASGNGAPYSVLSFRDATTPLAIAQLVKIQTWHMECFAEFLGKLAAMPDGDGTVLDNAMLVYGSNMPNSDSHNNHPLPTLLVGGARGRLAGGRHIAPREATPIANLQLSMLGLAGIEEKRFGDSTGALSL